MKVLFFIPFLLIGLFSLGQNSTIDSLKSVIESTGDDSIKVETILFWDELIYITDPKLDNELNLQIIEISKQNLSQLNLSGSKTKFYKQHLAKAYNVLGINEDDKGNYPQALDYYYQSLELSEALNDSGIIGGIYNNIGLIHEKLYDFEIANLFYKKSLKLEKLTNDYDGIVTAYNNIGSLFLAQNELDSSLIHYQTALAIAVINSEDYQLASTLGNIGVVYERLGEFDSSLVYYNKSLEVRQSINDWDGLSNVFANIGLIYVNKNQPELALENCRKGLRIAVENNAIYRTQFNCHCLYRAFKMKNNSDSSLYYLEWQDSLDLVLSDDEKTRAIAQKEIIYQTDKEHFADSLKHAGELELNSAIFEKSKAKSRLKVTLLVGGLILLALIGIIIYYRLNVTKKQKIEIEKQHELTRIQNEIISLQKHEIEQSINYAQLIQEATLPTLNHTDVFEQSFILYLPKDVVSGDFYWIEEDEQQQFFAVADCTGHGIPGAFISMIGTILLNEIYNSKQIKTPNFILNELNRLIQLTLDSGDTQMKDGMDISFCTLNKSTHVLSFSGANNPVWIVSNEKTLRLNNDEIIEPSLTVNNQFLFEIKADKQPVGKYYDQQKSFTLNQVKLNKGDCVYTFSDGFADQFGGPKGKKYKYKPFKQFLIEISNTDMNKQHDALKSEFFKWKGELEQIDDVCIMGVRV